MSTRCAVNHCTRRVKERLSFIPLLEGAISGIPSLGLAAEFTPKLGWHILPKLYLLSPCNVAQCILLYISTFTRVKAFHSLMRGGFHSSTIPQLEQNYSLTFLDVHREDEGSSTPARILGKCLVEIDAGRKSKIILMMTISIKYMKMLFMPLHFLSVLYHWCTMKQRNACK